MINAKRNNMSVHFHKKKYKDQMKKEEAETETGKKIAPVVFQGQEN